MFRCWWLLAATFGLACGAQPPGSGDEGGVEDTTGHASISSASASTSTTADDDGSATSESTDATSTDEATSEGSTTGEPLPEICQIDPDPVGLAVVLDGMEGTNWLVDIADEACVVADVMPIQDGSMLSLSCTSKQRPVSHEVAVTGSGLPDLAHLLGREVVLDAFTYADEGGISWLTLGDVEGKLALAHFAGVSAPPGWEGPEPSLVSWYDVTVETSSMCPAPPRDWQRVVFAFGADGETLELIDGSSGTLAGRFEVFVDLALYDAFAEYGDGYQTAVLVVALD